MNGAFERCMEVVAKWEGGWSDHPEDNGGATMYGVTIATLSAWRGHKVTKEDVRTLTREEAREIYKAWYWQPVRGDDLPAGVDLIAFDAAVNSGPSRSARWLQTAVQARPDGHVGPATLKAVLALDPKAVIVSATQIRLLWLMGLPDWKHFGRGWRNRVEDVRAQAMVMARDEEAVKQAALPSFLKGICSRIKGG